MSIGFWAAVPDSDFIVNFITRSATSLYTAALRTRSSCRLRISIGFWAAVPDSDFIADLSAWSWLSFHSDCAATIFRYGICRDGVNGPWKVHRFTPTIKAANCLRRFPTKKKPLGI